METVSFLKNSWLGWMLRYYLFGEKYRNLHYDFGDQNMENMKSVLFQEPYTNFYVLLYRPRYGDIVPMSKYYHQSIELKKFFVITETTSDFLK